MPTDETKSSPEGWEVNSPQFHDGPETVVVSAKTPEAAETVRAFKASLERLGRAVAGLRGTAQPERQTQKRGWQLDRITKVLPTVFPPDGRVPTNLTLKEVQTRLEPEFEKRGWKPPKVDSIARFLDRR